MTLGLPELHALMPLYSINEERNASTTPVVSRSLGVEFAC
jgi:hypothetical protein